ncbi:hypothetical protein BDY21DRAFT_109382 [Lineolata rhizophorae]|uniref:Uncharacterized protein n=1 Tax=Lineolata rhizophorae TaxID=578093 RepID=A0A6A6NRC5_9PEZI|nr:hypothetical protein BDY21DRAFT_109382 [Lineolata rhizophorae]
MGSWDASRRRGFSFLGPEERAEETTCVMRTEQWVVLSQARALRTKCPSLPDRVRQWTASGGLNGVPPLVGWSLSLFVGRGLADVMVHGFQPGKRPLGRAGSRAAMQLAAALPRDPGLMRAGPSYQREFHAGRRERK